MVEQLVTALLTGLNRPQHKQTPRETLAVATAILSEHLDAAMSVGCELIPETGGVPQARLIFAGDWLDPGNSQPALAANPVRMTPAVSACILIRNKPPIQLKTAASGAIRETLRKAAVPGNKSRSKSAESICKK